MLNTSDIQGGAARAVFRLHKALIGEGIDSYMLVQNKISDDYRVIELANYKLQKGMKILRPTIDQMPVKLYRNRRKLLFSPAWVGANNIVKKINEISPDIVHLHWICGGMLKIEDLAKIKFPIVWSLHDMWAFTGGCHYDEGCEGYKRNCGCCKVLGSHKEEDLSRRIFRRKQRVFSKTDDMIIVGLSEWLYECSKSSTLLGTKGHVKLPNPIDTDVFKPFYKKVARELWNLPQDKKLVLFGAINATDDPRKGFRELIKALNKLSWKNIEFMVFGSSKPQHLPEFKFKANYIGRLYDDVSLMTLYSACDVMIVPSKQEAFGQTAVEAMACGIPVVAFSHTGLLDIVDDRINGYLAKPFDTSDLARGIEWVLNSKNYDVLCKNAREKVLREFDSKVVAKKYVELYEQILQKRPDNEQRKEC